MAASGRMVMVGVVVVVVGALLASSCSQLTAEERSVIEASQRQTEEIHGDNDLGVSFTDAEGECVDRVAEDRGLDLVAAYTDGAAVDQRVMLIDVMIACTDVARSDVFVESFGRNLAAGTGGHFEVVTSEARCMVDAVLEEADDPARALVAPNDDDSVVLVAAFEECLAPEKFDVLIGAEGAGPQAYGDDPRLDLMYDECQAGDERVCDLLYVQSSLGSEYQQLAFDCAGRGALEHGYCAVDLQPNDEGRITDEQPGTRTIRADCEAADYTACDLLMQFSVLGSELEAVGNTCGGRIPVGALPDCRTRLGGGIGG